MSSKIQRLISLIMPSPSLLSVFPTQVGVSLILLSDYAHNLSFPHTSGGEPMYTNLRKELRAFSPHKWG